MKGGYCPHEMLND